MAETTENLFVKFREDNQKSIDRLQEDNYKTAKFVTNQIES